MSAHHRIVNTCLARRYNGVCHVHLVFIYATHTGAESLTRPFHLECSDAKNSPNNTMHGMVHDTSEKQATITTTMQSTRAWLEEGSPVNKGRYHDGEENSLSCFFASPTFRAAFVRSSWMMYSLRSHSQYWRCNHASTFTYRSSRIANMPASVMTLRKSAPLKPSDSCKR